MRTRLSLFISFVLLVLCVSSLSARTWYIKPDGSGDAPTIQAGIDSAAVADTVLLANGIYTGDGNRDIDYNGKAITVRSESGDPELCIIDCQGSASEHHRGFIFHSGEGAGSVLSGVTISNGHFYDPDPYPPDPNHFGGGIHCSSSPLIIDCKLSNNVSDYGGGMHCSGQSPTLINCTFSSNVASVYEGFGGGMHCSGQSPTLINCTFSGNGASYSGGAIYIESPSAILNNCTFSNNGASYSGGAVQIKSSSATINNCVFLGNGSYIGAAIDCLDDSATITGCTFSNNNNSDAGVISFGGSTASVTNCVFYNNKNGWFAGVAYITQSAPIFDNCLFYGNSNNQFGTVSCMYTPAPTFLNCTFYGNSVDYGGTICCVYTNPRIENTIIAFNLRAGAISCINSNPTFICCDIFGNVGGDGLCGTDGGGNINSDPFFCNPDSGDFTLLAASPCLPQNNPSCGLVGAFGQGCSGVYTPVGTNVVVVPPDSATGAIPVTVTFVSIAVAGATSLEITDNGPPPPSGFKLTKPKTYYYLATTAVFDGTIEVCVNYKGMVVGRQDKLQLEHYVAGHWDSCTSYHNFADSIICCDNLSSLSPFAILEPISYAFDIHPRSCPNPFNIKWLENVDQGDGNDNAMPKKGGVMPAAIVGSESFDVAEIDISTLLLEGVAPLRSSFEDVTRPAMGDDECACTTGGPDGFADLTLKFSRQEVAATFGPVEDGDVLVLTLTGSLQDGTPFEASDCVTILQKHPEPVFTGSDEVQLKPAIPNPFNPVTKITYWLPKDEHVRLSIYDVAGRLIEELVAGSQNRGQHVVEWDASSYASGTYFIRLEVGTEVKVRRVTLVK